VEGVIEGIRRHARRLLAAAALASLAIVPSGAAVVLSAEPEADGIVIATVARYQVDPRDARVRVIVEVEATNVSGTSPRPVAFRGIRLPVHDEAVRVRATASGRDLSVTTAEIDGFDEVTVGLVPALAPGGTRTLTLAYDLPGGRPRSASDVRVGRAFATFPVWAFGDVGTVEVELPRSFSVRVVGDAMARTEAEDLTLLSASVSDPETWIAWVTAHDRRGLTRERLALRPGEAVIVRGWPEDGEWVERVSDVLTRGLPALRDLIGLPWPVTGDLDVVEVHTPLLEGFAGFFDPDTDQITMSEELDEVTILHEAGHAWFNPVLWQERWINEGFAEEFAIRTLAAVGIDVPGPPPAAPDDAVAFPLSEWPPPRAIVDVATFDRERYGYEASREVIRQLVELTGEDGMRAVLAAARARITAYAGEGRPEPWSGPSDWRRLLDLVEGVGGAEDAEDVFADWVVNPGDRDLLADRDRVRAAYAALVEEGDGWHPPYAVRQPMGEWMFDEALRRIEVARSVLRGRDEAAAAAAAIGLSVPPGLEAAYEGTSGGGPSLAGALELARSQAAVARDLGEAMAAVDAERDLLTSLGLLGTAPEAGLQRALGMWELGRLDEASSAARAVVGSLAMAGDLGAGRLSTALAVAVVVLVVIVAAVLVARRRRAVRFAAFATLAHHPSPPALDVPVTAANATIPIPTASVGDPPAGSATERAEQGDDRS